MSNYYSLNPNSQLVIKRYDGISKAKLKTYEKNIRQFFKTQKVNREQAQKYKQDLKALWNME